MPPGRVSPGSGTTGMELRKASQFSRAEAGGPEPRKCLSALKISKVESEREGGGEPAHQVQIPSIFIEKAVFYCTSLKQTLIITRQGSLSQAALKGKVCVADAVLCKHVFMYVYVCVHYMCVHWCVTACMFIVSAHGSCSEKPENAPTAISSPCSLAGVQALACGNFSQARYTTSALLPGPAHWLRAT